MGYDAKSNAALLAALTARVVGGQFTLSMASTTLWHVDHPMAAAVAPVTATRILVSWSATYRSLTVQVPIVGAVQSVGTPVVGYDVLAGLERHFGPTRADPYAESLVCDSGQLQLAIGLLLQNAQDKFNEWDQRCKDNARRPLGRGP